MAQEDSATNLRFREKILGLDFHLKPKRTCGLTSPSSPKRGASFPKRWPRDPSLWREFLLLVPLFPTKARKEGVQNNKAGHHHCIEPLEGCGTSPL